MSSTAHQPLPGYWLTTSTLATAFAVSKETIIYWRKNHDLPTIKIPIGKDRALVRFDPQSIILWAKLTHRPILHPEVLTCDPT